MKVLAICGSMRESSSTDRALDIILDAARDAGADEVQKLSVRLLELPPCDGRPDHEPYGPAVESYRALVMSADAVVVGSPEYHGSLSGTLKNALDLLGPEYLRGKMVALVATARGEAGAMNTLNHLRHICRWMDAWVLPHQVSVPKAQEAFDRQSGQALRPGLDDELRRLGAELVRYAGLLGKM